MTLKEIYNAFKRYDNSWKYYCIGHKDKLIHWQDWNGNEHIASSIEELEAQLREAPICQTAKKN